MFFLEYKGMLLKYVVKDYLNSNIYKYKNMVFFFKRNCNILMFLLYFKLVCI